MNRLFQASMVIARRDFVATVWSRTFLLFLFAPVIALGFGALMGAVAGQADLEAQQPVVALAIPAEEAAAVEAARGRLATVVSDIELPRLRAVMPAPDPAAQAERLLASEEDNFSAVLTGTLGQPTLTGPRRTTETVGRQMELIIQDALKAQALRGAGLDVPEVAVERVASEQAAGAVQWVRHALARAGQMLIFILTLLLAGMLLSNLVEEKSNKIIEILAAAVPLDAVFLGKLVAMLGVSVVGLGLWGALAGIALLFIQGASNVAVAPAVGWFAYSLLIVFYFAFNYMLLGAVFLGIGGQASNVREVQTLSMPITFAQVIIFALASLAVGDPGGWLSVAGAIFPLSSPLVMVAIAAQSDALWPHLLAVPWQLLWIWLIIRISVRLFRRNVLKSGKPTRSFAQSLRFWRA